MPSTSYIDGSTLRLHISNDGGTTYAVMFHAQEADFNFTRETNQIITKDIGGGTGWQERQPKSKSGTITMSGLIFYAVDGSTEFNVEEIASLFDAGTSVHFQWSTQVSGDPIYSGQAVITSWGETANADEESSYNLTMETTGAVTFGTVTP